MPSYNWLEHRDDPWEQRFPDTLPGSETWRQFAGNPRSLVQELADERREGSKRPLRPCVFVSHRRSDAKLALRIAYLVCEQGFDYWLDVLDPNLASLGVAGPGLVATAATAAVIEMALLNSTHVLAVVTPELKGSEWVPYEYGRVKAPAPVSPQAACWVQDRNITLPEYMYLGPIHYDETDINHWLQSFRVNHWLRSFGPPVSRCRWMRPEPAPLPYSI